MLWQESFLFCSTLTPCGSILASLTHINEGEAWNDYVESNTVKVINEVNDRLRLLYGKNRLLSPFLKN